MNTAPLQIAPSVIDTIKRQLNAKQVIKVELIQSLWSGYGELFRAYLSGANTSSVIVKHIKLPRSNAHHTSSGTAHPKGWNTSLSHQRKLKSYQVEVSWYQHYANKLTSLNCYALGESTLDPSVLKVPNSKTISPVPRCLFVEQSDHETLLILEDLHTLGFNQVLKVADSTAISACLNWLGHFHGKYMFINQVGSNTKKSEQSLQYPDLWSQGGYWHLNTRPDELEALTDLRLKTAAPLLDKALSDCQYQTLIHGDAKLANFCFSENHQHAAAVDFQYIGKGCGMKDVALFLSSVMLFTESEAQINAYLDEYFAALTISLADYQPDIDAEQVQHTWRPLYAFAWADFQRFIKGWSPVHQKINPYTEALTSQALDSLTGI
ncbi:choline kinase [Shewanella sp. UCD-FRSSP16_17]|uniref:phosphotransferase n=1 Tax=Shewanella sp. UCD-FRSSP16_17 TaxID=1853256 RepID=UPI0007EEA03E|nr:phosphotransferase [Shewanella sp. UCD-FRSSP16_17]OBT06804.1 choline kinase [Shewanella sp. UCD-FRSSP16_17]